MANEYLKRTPTSTGNQRVWTWSFWVKLNDLSVNNWFLGNGDTGGGSATEDNLVFISSNGSLYSELRGNSSGAIQTTSAFRDVSSWYHIMQSIDTTKAEESDRVRLYVNGVLQRTTDASTYPTINQILNTNGTTYEQVLGRRGYADSNPMESCFFDWFLVDGQALTPDVFGFYKQGKGYISAGSTQATDFRPGQWVPKTPRVIKTEINRRGGFGVNGFYLPMNDSSNFGADFHCEPNSIITLKGEDLPQPRNGAPTTSDSYVSQLRTDPYAANLVLAVPGIIGAPGVAYTDFSANIKGSGTNKVITANGNAGVAVTASYYGSALSFTGIAGTYFSLPNSSDLRLGSDDFTIECWVNINSSASDGFIFGAWNTTNNRRSYILWSDNGVLSFNGSSNGSDSSNPVLATSGVRLNQWNHVAVEKKSNVVTLYVNGVAAGIATNTTALYDNTQDNFIIGGEGGGSNREFNGYIQDLRVYKGVAKYTGGFDVPRPYTPVGIATWRAVPDTTANNFATLNPLIEARPSSGTDSPSNSTLVTFAGGNLDLTNSASSGNAQRMYSFGTIGISTGRWYWEVRAGSNDAVAISKGFQQKKYGSNLGSGSGIEASVGYLGGGSVSIANTAYYSTATTLTPPTFDTTNIIGIAVSANSGLNNLTVQWFKDGVGVSTVTGIGATSPVLEWFPSRLVSSSGSGGDSKYNFGQNPTFSGNTTAGTFTDSNGKGLFKYQPPSGFLALCEDNLPTPAISDPGKYFKTVLWTGDGSNGRSIVGVGFTPDLIWYKPRNVTGYHGIVDSVRGAGIQIYPNDTLAEAAGFYQSSFDSNGFGVNYNASGSTNNSGSTYVAWCWRAGAGTTSTNTNGSITSVVSVNQDAGFSIVSYTGNGSSPTTVGHGLTKAPRFIIFKCRNAAVNWFVYHGSMGPSGIFEGLNTNSAYSASATAVFNNTAPSSSVITLGGVDSNTNGRTYIAYCWAEIEGFSKFGSYVGNGNADGPFVYCGFKPAWIMIKRTAGAADWVIHDSSRTAVNPSDTALRPNTTDIDLTATTLYVDFLSNGFKIRNANGSYNNAETYAFAAFAESPFQTANSK